MTSGHLVSLGEQTLYAALFFGLAENELGMAFAFAGAFSVGALHRFLYTPYGDTREAA